MKQKLFTLLLAVAASVGTMFAEKVQISDLYYNLDATNQTAEVTSQNSSYPYWSTTITTANIPSSVEYNSVTYTVTSIGDDAFYNCSSLTSVTMPNSVTSIGMFAFSGCTGLTSLVYNAHVFAFMPTSYSGAYTIPDGIESIAGGAFDGCTGLTSVTIPNSVTSIGSGAFDGCTGLTSVTIPNSVTSIGSGAFSGCSGLTSPIYNAHVFAYLPTSYSGAYTIPDGIESIAGSAFSGCSGLTSVTIGNSVTSIGYKTFSGCSGLTSVTIGNSVTSIGDWAFSGCSGLTSVTIPNSVTSIGYWAFWRCTGLTSMTIPNSVTSFDWSAFDGCSGLTSLSVEAGNTVYDSRNNCNAIIETSTNTLIFGCQNTTIPNSVTSIGSSAFRGCSGLTSVSIPNSVTSIGGVAFADCSGLTSVTIEAETPPALGLSVFNNTNDCPIYVPCGTIDAYTSAWPEYASRITYTPLAYRISTQAENGSVTTTDVTTLTICDEPFVTCTAMPDYGYHFTQWSDGLKDNPRIAQITQDTTFTAEFAPDRVGTCGKDLALVWSYDPTNKVLTIGNAGEFTENMQFGVEAPGEMEELVIGNNVTAIGENAFANISTLKKVTIGEAVKTIHNNAFYNCVNLETIFNYRPTPTNAYSTAFDGVDKFECVLYVLPNSIDMYKAAAVWRDFYYTYAIGAEETTVATNDVQVEPQDNAATLTWPTSNNAASYTIQITKDGVVFCTLIFNGNGQLTGIAFAPGREGAYHAPAAIMTANGLQFTVTGLDSNTQYGYSVTAKDANDQPVATYSGEFTTTSEGEATGVEEVSSSLQGGDRGRLILRDGQIYILRGEKVYTVDGRQVR